MHEFFGDDGAPCRQADAYTVVVTREAEWDATSRGRALRLAEYEGSICGCGCGQPTSIAYDPYRIFMVEELNCYAGRALERVRTAKHDQAEQAGWPKDWDAGKHFYVRPHDPVRDRPPSPAKRKRGGVQRADQDRPGSPQG